MSGRLARSALAALVVAIAACEPPAGAGTDATPASGSSPEANATLDREYRELTRVYNEKTGARQMTVEALRARLAEERASVVILDTREPHETEVSTLPGARAVPPRTVGDVELDAPANATIVTYCTAGYRSGLAAVALEKRLGRPVHSLDGGIIAWFNAGGDVVDDAGRITDRIHTYSDEWGRFVHPRNERDSEKLRERGR